MDGEGLAVRHLGRIDPRRYGIVDHLGERGGLETTVYITIDTDLWNAKCDKASSYSSILCPFCGAYTLVLKNTPHVLRNVY